MPNHAYQPLRPTLAQSSLRLPVALLALSFLLVLGGGYFSYTSDVDLTSLATTTGERIVSAYHSFQGPRMCSMEEYDVGRWEMRREGVLRDMDELIDVFAMGPTQLECNPANKSDDHLTRILTTASYEWHPASGCELVPWDWEAFVVRLLQSYAGLWVVGDSISQQMHLQLLMMLVLLPDSPLVRRDSGTYINLNHPRAPDLLRRANVSDSRAERPVLSWVRNLRLLDGEELKQCWEETGVPSKAEIIDAEMPPWIPQFRAYSAEHDRLLSQIHGGQTEEYAYKPSILMVNTGPHWFRAKLGIKTDAETLAVYSNCARRVMDVVESFPQVQFYYRTASPGHSHCENISGPQLDEADGHVPDNSPFNWNQFPDYNDVWRGLVQDADDSSRYSVIDTWKMASQRGDAHTTPPGDCLHHCLPTIPYEWVRLLWHDLSLRSGL
ncbi:hypothetical protein MNV49_001698 [Pseudohyphozyma bogoriensis]|nr:hypothetical protein MNV49_001698 [Pseudohyphozyma bogoriensis]